MHRIIANATTLFVAPLIAAVSLAATPVKVEQVQAGLEVAIARQSIPKRRGTTDRINEVFSLTKRWFNS